MTEFAPAVRTNTAIVLALAGASGSGKTKSALELAVGLAETSPQGSWVGGDGPRGQILMIDTEGRRALHYADEYRFLHYEWRPPFTPKALGDLLRAADRQEIVVVIIDSMSDEWEGEGGLCDMKEAEVAEQRKKGWDVNDAAAWAKPKAQHKLHIVRWLRQARCHVIFCLRADEKVRFEKQWKDGKERTVVVPIGWTPITEKRLLYDVTTSLLFTPDRPGIPKPIKLYDKHAPFFPPDRQVSREAGKSLAEWAAGGAVSGSDRGAMPVPATPPPPLGEADIDALRDDLNATAESKAGEGTAEFRGWWKVLPTYERNLIRGMLRRYEGMAREADDGGRG